MLKYQEIEHSIITNFRKSIWRKFSKAVRDYELVKENDRIAVCISGGKDSMLLAKLMQELKRHGKFRFDLEFIVMDPGYDLVNLEKIKENASIMDIPIKIFTSDIFEVSEKLNSKHPCYMCARMRRGFLYQKAKDLGCNKIALGHHFDDVIETVLLSLFYGGEFKSMPPKLRSTNFLGMELIRPMYLIRECDIKKFSVYHSLDFINCACKFTRDNLFESNSKRKEIKTLISSLKDINKNVEYNIFKATENVNIETLLGYKSMGEKHSFLENYDIDE